MTSEKIISTANTYVEGNSLRDREARRLISENLMNVTYTINNYTVGAKLKTAPTHKLVKRERINSNHTVVTFEGLTANEKAFCDKLFGKTS